MKSKLFIAMVAIATLSFVSCEKEVDQPSIEKNQVEISDISSVPANVLKEIFLEIEKNTSNKPDGSLKVSRDTYGTYPLLVSTGYAYQYLSAKTYAVKMTRSWWEGTNYYSGTFTAENQGTGTVYVYLYDKNWVRLSYNSYVVNSTTARTFYRIPLAGSNQLLVFFTANSADNYVTWIGI